MAVIANSNVPPTGPRRRLTLTGLRVTGPGVAAADLPLGPGLNVVCGASDTGKSHVLECIDFALGASTPPRRLPENERYTRVFLGLRAAGFPEVTLCRPFDANDIALIGSELAAAEETYPTEQLGGQHEEGDESTLSVFLLSRCGFDSRRLRANLRGRTQSLSFRNLAHFCAVPEERMFKKDSPARTGNKPQDTVLAATLALLVSGRDDAALVEAPDPKIRKAQLEAKVGLLNDLLTERRHQLGDETSTSQQVVDRLRALAAEVAALTDEAGSVQEQIQQMEFRRRDLVRERQDLDAREGVLGELVTRFELLASHYTSDLERLAAMREAADSFVLLDVAECPLCRASPPGTNSSSDLLDVDVEAFGAATSAERQKIESLRSDLEKTTLRLQSELAEVRARRSEVNAAVAEVSNTLEATLAPRERATGTQLKAAVDRQAALTRLLGLLQEIDRLELARSGHERELKAKKPKQKAVTRDDSGPFDRLATAVEEVLREWKWPGLQRVSFDTKALDLVIDGRPRGSHGKGYRALAHAAFMVGLMFHCRSEGLPHPGFVLLDSPILTLQQPEEDDDDAADDGDVAGGPTSPDEAARPESDELITSHMKDAFYAYLSRAAGDDQIVVLENDRPPRELRPNIRYQYFTKLTHRGRYGFYPSAKVV